MITGGARLAGVVGWPVAHSRSPLLHNHWLAKAGIDGAFVPLAVEPASFELAIRGLAACGFRGVNVTIPHKEAAFALCDTLDEAARRAGAANMLVFGPHGIAGSNTDGIGFLANLAAHGAAAAGPTLLLGAGGAARAIASAFLGIGVRVCVANRSQARAASLAAALPGLQLLDWAHREQALGDFSLLVNTTSLGMQHQPPLEMDLSRATPGLVVADIVYVPLETPLLRQARARGLAAVPGLGMLLHQAVPGFEAWFGVRPEVDAQTWALMSAGIPAQ